MSSVNSILQSIKVLTVVELSELVKSIETEFGVSASAPTSTATSASAQEAGPAKAEEKNEYKVMLKDTGSQKIAVIKAIRTVLTSLGLKEIQDMVGSTPCELSKAMPKAAALEFKKALELAGATVELV